MGSRQVLDLSEFTFRVHLLDKQELATVDDRFGHHVFQADFLDLFNNLVAFVPAGRNQSSFPPSFAPPGKHFRVVDKCRSCHQSGGTQSPY